VGLIHKYTPDYKVIFVGDATMSPYEILQPGGSVEYNNAEAGAVWLNRMIEQFPRFVWLNPEPEGLWQYRQSITVINQIMKNRMYPVTRARGSDESAMKVPCIDVAPGLAPGMPPLRHHVDTLHQPGRNVCSAGR
jgi:uncharacterized protein with von Willebrand factor type A (vWA) domain